MNSIKCPHCGLVNWATAETCKRCEFAFAGNEAAAAESQWTESPNYFQNEQQPNQWDYNNAGYGHQGGGYAYSGGYSRYAEGPKKTGLAIASMVIGIISMIACGLFGLGSLVGLILGIVALSKAKKMPMEYGGQGFAIAGIVLSVVSFFYIGIVAAITIPNLLASRRAANEAAAITSLRELTSAQATFQSTTGAGKYGTLPELARAGLVEERLAQGSYFGYVFEVKTNGTSYEAFATPKKDGDKSSRSFYTSETGVIRGAKKGGMAATAFDPPINLESSPRYRQAYQPANAPPEYSPAY